MDNKSRKRVVKPHYGSVEWEEEEEKNEGEREKKDMARIKSLLSDEEILQCCMAGCITKGRSPSPSKVADWEGKF